MSKLIQLDRRSFLKTASLSAVGGSLASVTNIGSAAETGSGGARNGKYNFNEIYDRDGTGSHENESTGYQRPVSAKITIIYPS